MVILDKLRPDPNNLRGMLCKHDKTFLIYRSKFPYHTSLHFTISVNPMVTPQIPQGGKFSTALARLTYKGYKRVLQNPPSLKG